LDEEQRPIDTDIAEAIAHILMWNTTLPREGVTAEVADGTVTLRGAVAYEFQRYGAARLVRDVIGVRSVRNLIELESGPDPARVVESTIANAFDRQAALDARRIHVTVAGSTAILSGHVHSETEERNARVAACAAPGVTKVESRLTVEPHGVP
jgi:osmotically-inducible protein OsmY